VNLASINRVFFNALSHSHAQPAAASEADRESVFAELKEQPVVHPSIITVVATINQLAAPRLSFRLLMGALRTAP
jgi:hypothetical protein